MRSTFKSALVALIAVLALGAVVCASAFAADPEFTGGFPNTFKGEMGGTTFLIEGIDWSARAGSISGTLTGAKEVSGVSIVFTGIEGTNKTYGCENGEDDLTLTSLHGRIGYISKESKTVGLLLSPTSGSVVADCHGSFFGTQEIVGSIIGGITPVNRETKTFALAYNTLGGKQELTHFEGEEAIHNLEDNWGGTKTHSTFKVGSKQITMVFTKSTELKA